MAGWTKVLNIGDPATDLTGTAYRLLLVDLAGDVVELAHGASTYVLTSGGAAADPTWAAPSAGAHALDAGQSDVTITTPVAHELLAYNGTDTWINETAAEAGLAEVGAAPTAHLLGAHTTDTLANLNGVVTDATLIDTGDSRLSDTRTPTNDSVGAAQIDAAATDIAFAQVILTPAATGTGTTEGTLMYDSDDNHLYVYVV